MPILSPSSNQRVIDKVPETSFSGPVNTLKQLTEFRKYFPYIYWIDCTKGSGDKMHMGRRPALLQSTRSAAGKFSKLCP
jgi:hypothetical protein